MPVDFDIRSDVQIPEPLLFLPETTLSPELLGQLRKIRAAFAFILPRFDRWCIPIATFVEEQTSIPRVAGYYNDPDPYHPHMKYAHCWNRTQDGRLYVDLTHRQYNPRAPEIAIMESAPQRILTPDSGAAHELQLATYCIPPTTKARLQSFLASVR